ncbi:hypothetical protein ANACOL_00271 [Anaerotruncus colihominis DSM 17241]|uniref:Uncharacterized protein n=1 Tax=Anaerotruncus colihominis DSM 17241 TaxID=445972 RepID=B0P699_9FIRM|nr:hypothetical protein ANACOL_00271 [Anaerotruncus colihominis DSM 17241]
MWKSPTLGFLSYELKNKNKEPPATPAALYFCSVLYADSGIACGFVIPS